MNDANVIAAAALVAAPAPAPAQVASLIVVNLAVNENVGEDVALVICLFEVINFAGVMDSVVEHSYYFPHMKVADLEVLCPVSAFGFTGSSLCVP